MYFHNGFEAFARIPVCRIVCRVDDSDVKAVGRIVLYGYIAQACWGLWALSVEATGETVGDRHSVGFFFHFTGFILFVKYCCEQEKTAFFTKVGFYFGNGKCLGNIVWIFLKNGGCLFMSVWVLGRVLLPILESMG